MVSKEPATENGKAMGGTEYAGVLVPDFDDRHEVLAAFFSGFSYSETYRKTVLAACREAIRAGAAVGGQKVTEARLDDLARVHPAYLDYLTRHLRGRILWEREFLKMGGMR